MALTLGYNISIVETVLGSGPPAATKALKSASLSTFPPNPNTVASSDVVVYMIGTGKKRPLRTDSVGGSIRKSPSTCVSHGPSPVP